MRLKTFAVALVAGALTLSLTACGGRRGDSGSEDGSRRLTIATGNTTGVYYALGGGLARLIDRHVEGVTATATETGASVQNIEGVVNGRYDIGFSLMDSASDAVRGGGAFDEPQDVEALLRLYPNYTQVLARADSGITSVADMKGKRVSTGSPNSGTEVIALRLLEAAGLDPDKDVHAQRLGLPETVDGMKDGKIDAMFWSGGLPTGGVTDLTTVMGEDVRFLDLSELLPPLREEYGPIYSVGTIPAKTYAQPEDVPTIVVPNVLVVRKGFDRDLAGRLVELIFDRKNDLVSVNPAAEGILLETALQTDPIPVNPGAEQALRRLGVD